MRHSVQAVIFDFDYTLADSSRGAMECINFALNSLNLPGASLEVVRQTIGLSLAETFLRIAGQEQHALSAEFARLFVLRADDVMAAMTSLYPSVRSTTMQLKRNGIVLGIVSTKFRYRIEALLSRENMSDIFDIVVGGEDVTRHKPDSEGLRMAIERLGVPSTRTLYVGDSVIDAETARRGNVPFVAILSGVTSANEFDQYAPRRVVDNLYQLVDWLLY